MSKPKKIEASHCDHNITQHQLDWLLEQAAPSGTVAIQTFQLPPELGTVPCGLHGPEMGDDPIPESEVFYYPRGERLGESRLCHRTSRHTRQVTVITGPHESDSCALYTAFGGPPAPREPFEFDEDDDCQAALESREFWASHALTHDGE